MSTVRYETDDAIFYFDLEDVEQILKHLLSENNIPEAVKLLRTISSNPADLIPVTSSYFQFITLDLLNEEKGSVLCSACRKTYAAQNLKSIPIGCGKSPFSVPQSPFKKKGGFLRRLFRKRTRLRLSSFGGEEYLCPEGHELISVRTWIS